MNLNRQSIQRIRNTVRSHETTERSHTDTSRIVRDTPRRWFFAKIDRSNIDYYADPIYADFQEVYLEKNENFIQEWKYRPNGITGRAEVPTLVVKVSQEGEEDKWEFEDRFVAYGEGDIVLVYYVFDYVSGNPYYFIAGVGGEGMMGGAPCIDKLNALCDEIDVDDEGNPIWPWVDLHCADKLNKLCDKLDDDGNFETCPENCKGEQGEKGDPGKDGKDGIDGKDGEDGKDGIDGIDGKDGEKGEKGDPGENGKDGKDGANGRDGRDGRDGIDGKDGKNGEPGPEGPEGPEGPQGEPGKDGKDGADGKDGRDGQDGVDGSIDLPIPMCAGQVILTGNSNGQGIPSLDWLCLPLSEAVITSNNAQIEPILYPKTGTITVVTDVFVSGTALQKKTRNLTFNRGVLVDMGNESTSTIDSGTTCPT